MIGQTTILEKSVKAEGAITAYTIGKYGSDDHNMAPAAAVSDLLIGVFQHDALNGTEVRIMLSGVTRVKAGGNITRGNPITSDASAQGVVAAPATGVNNRIIGFAMASGVSGDIIPVLLNQSVMQGA